MISLFPLKGNVQEYVTVCKKRHLKKWNVSAFGSFTLRFSFIIKRGFGALKNWNIDWINVTLPVSVFLETSSFVAFVWSFTLLDATSKINRSKIWIHIQYSIFIFSLLAWEKDFRSLQRESSPPTYSTRLLRVQACLQSTFTYGYMLRSNIQSNQPTNRASFRLLLGRVQSKSQISIPYTVYLLRKYQLMLHLVKVPLFNRGEDHKK